MAEPSGGSSSSPLAPPASMAAAGPSSSTPQGSFVLEANPINSGNSNSNSTNANSASSGNSISSGSNLHMHHHHHHMHHHNIAQSGVSARSQGRSIPVRAIHHLHSTLEDDTSSSQIHASNPNFAAPNSTHNSAPNLAGNPPNPSAISPTPSFQYYTNSTSSSSTSALQNFSASSQAASSLNNPSSGHLPGSTSTTNFANNTGNAGVSGATIVSSPATNVNNTGVPTMASTTMTPNAAMLPVPPSTASLPLSSSSSSSFSSAAAAAAATAAAAAAAANVSGAGRRSGNPSPVAGRKSPRGSPRTSPMPRTSPAHGRSASPLYVSRTSPRASPVTATAWSGLTSSGASRNKSPHHHVSGNSNGSGGSSSNNSKSAFNKVKPKRGQAITPQGNAELQQILQSPDSSAFSVPQARTISASTGTPTASRRSSSRSPVLVSGAARSRLSPSNKAFGTSVSASAAAATATLANSSSSSSSSSSSTTPTPTSISTSQGKISARALSQAPPSPSVLSTSSVVSAKPSYQRQDPTSRDLEFLLRGRDGEGRADAAPVDDPGFGSDNELMMYSSTSFDEHGHRRRPSSSGSTEPPAVFATYQDQIGSQRGMHTSGRPKSCTGSFSRRMASPTFEAADRARLHQLQHADSINSINSANINNNQVQDYFTQQPHGTTTAETKYAELSSSSSSLSSSASISSSTAPSPANFDQLPLPIQGSQQTATQGQAQHRGRGQLSMHPRMRSNSLDSPLRAKTGRGKINASQSQNQNMGWTANAQQQLQQASARRQQIKLNQQHALQMQLLEHQHNHQMQQRQIMQQESGGGDQMLMGSAIPPTSTANESLRSGPFADVDELTLEEIFEYERRLHSRKAQLLRERVFASQPQGSTSQHGSDLVHVDPGMLQRTREYGSMSSQEFEALMEMDYLADQALGGHPSTLHARDRSNSGNCILDDIDDAYIAGPMDFDDGEMYADIPDGARAPNVKMFRSCDRNASGYISPGSMGSATTPVSVELEGDTVEELRNKISEGFSKNLSRSPGNISFVSRLAVKLDSRPTVARLKSPSSSQVEAMRHPIETNTLSPERSKIIGSLRSPRSAFSRAQKNEGVIAGFGSVSSVSSSSSSRLSASQPQQSAQRKVLRTQRSTGVQ